MSNAQPSKLPGKPLRLAIAGVGPHFQTRYIDVLERLQDDLSLELTLVVDLKSRESDVRAFFADRDIKPNAFAFVPDAWRNTITADDLDRHLAVHTDRHSIDAVIISTEPKAHKAYAIWACRHGIDVFMDKPVTAFNGIGNARALSDDFKEILSAHRAAGTRFALSCERRIHPGYEVLRTVLKGIIATYRIPITHVAVRYGGGVWNIPNELVMHENHPHRYGYGTLLHSGYHYADLLCGLVDLNRSLLGLECRLDPADLASIASTGNDVTFTIEQGRPIFCLPAVPGPATGEIDFVANGKYRHGQNTVTTFSLTTLQHTLSTRASADPIGTFYTDGGMVRQEDVWINLGPFCSIHVSSLPFEKLQPQSGAGEHFVITIFRNSGVIGGEPIQRIDRNDLIAEFPAFDISRGLNVASRKLQLEAFLKGSETNSHLASHERTIEFLVQIFDSLHNRQVS